MRVSRRLTTGAVAFACIAALMVLAAPAGAVVTDGRMLIKGPGSVYSDASAANLSAAPGKTVTFGIKVVNNGPNQAQYKLTLTQPQSGVRAVLYDGSTAVLSAQYWTPLMAPGASKLLTLKLTSDLGILQNTYDATLLLSRAEDNSDLVDKLFALNIAAPAKGTTPFDLFVHQGAQPNIGGSVGGEVMGAPAVKVGGSGVYTLRLQNDGAAPGTIGLRTFGPPNCANFVATFKVGTVDVTAAVTSGNYFTPVLAAGAHKDLTLTLKYAALSPSCTAAYFGFYTQNAARSLQTYEYVQLPVAA